MARQARIEYPGALHHVRSRGNRRDAIFLDDADRLHFLELLAEAVQHHGWVVYAWVLMTSHYHLAIKTPVPNLSSGMGWLLGTYVSWFNKRHDITGHLLGDRLPTLSARGAREQKLAAGDSPRLSQSHIFDVERA